MVTATGVCGAIFKALYSLSALRELLKGRAPASSTSGSSGAPRMVWTAVLALLTAAPAFGQEAESPDSDVETFADWGLRCRSDDAGAKHCYLFQNILLREGRQRIFHIAVGYRAGEQQAMALLTAPLGTYLPPGVTLRVDEGEPFRVYFEHCNPDGCHASLSLGAEQVDAWKRGLNIGVAIHDAAGRRVGFPVSLQGFTRGYEALQKTIE